MPLPRTTQDMDQLRAEAASILIKAAEDGTLEAVLSNSAKARPVVGHWWVLRSLFGRLQGVFIPFLQSIGEGQSCWSFWRAGVVELRQFWRGLSPSP